MKKPLLIDLDGVLRIGKEIAPNVEKFFDLINKLQIPSCILSNSTLSTTNDVRQFFEFNGIHTKIPILTAVEAAAMYARVRYRRVAVFCTDHVKSLFRGLLDYDNPQAIIIGDYGKKWDFETLNYIFRKVKDGAELIAMHKKRSWKTAEDGLLLDVGPFVVAIEYATKKEATIIGKPSELYFASALSLFNLEINDPFIMIGDDIETDIEPAKKLGAETIFFNSEKNIPKEIIEKAKPDFIVNDLEEVINILKQKF
ncbi:MAG: HAD hydrolase-like protein [Melioribacteraceae bacterium]|nr:HAD hydrolase-like protein [Melioribacteraceae bacterium]